MPNNVQSILNLLNARAPTGTAEKWDNVGLLVGDPAWKTRGAVLSIDLTEKAIAVAKKKGYRLIINHHPCIFGSRGSRGLSAVTASSHASRLVHLAIREGIAVAASHTNFDKCALEVIESVAGSLGVAPKGRLHEVGTGSLLKLVVFVPATHLDEIRTALAEAGAGHIGHYDSCTFTTEGQGTFRGSKHSKPAVGRAGKLETVAEVRLETLIPRGMKKSILQILQEVHPYEEVAYDLYPVEQEPSANGRGLGLAKGLGYGFWGDFPAAKSFSEVSRGVKRIFGINGFWVTDPAPRKIKRIGFVAGKGASFLEAAISAGCDLFVTGEAGYHTVLEGARRSMAVMELGHRESEKFFAPTVAGWLKDAGFKSVEVSVPTQRIAN